MSVAQALPHASTYAVRLADFHIELLALKSGFRVSDSIQICSIAGMYTMVHLSAVPKGLPLLPNCLPFWDSYHYPLL